MTLFELTVYSPTIEEVWKEMGMSKLKVDGSINGKWNETFEAAAYTAAKYVISSQVERANRSWLELAP